MSCEEEKKKKKGSTSRSRSSIKTLLYYYYYYVIRIKLKKLSCFAFYAFSRSFVSSSSSEDIKYIFSVILLFNNYN